KVAAQYPPASRWDLKYARGGLIDIEFLAQTMQLAHAPAAPAILDTNTIAALEKITTCGFLSGDEGRTLIAAARLQGALTQILRVALEEKMDPDGASPGLKALLVRAGGAADFPALEGRLAGLQDAARAIFEGRLGQGEMA